MKTAALTKRHQFRIVEKQKPVIQKDTDILVRMKKVGVCGSDIHYFTTGRIGDQIIEYPFIVGHEATGVIEKIGSAVRGLNVGQRIAIEPSVSCMKCDQCKAGRYHTCRNNLFLGCPGQLEGALREYMILSPSNCFPVSDNITDDEAVATEPLSIALYAVKRSQILPSQKTAILGFGPIGHSVFLALKAHQIPVDLITEKIGYRIDIAKAEGIKHTFNPNDKAYAVQMSEFAEIGYDVIFECCGKQEAILDGINLLKPGGKLVIVGIPEEMEIYLPIHTLRRKEIDILNIRRQLNCVEEAIELLETKKIDISKMVTHQFNLDETQKVFDLVANYQDGVMKAMINIE